MPRHNHILTPHNPTPAHLYPQNDISLQDADIKTANDEANREHEDAPLEILSTDRRSRSKTLARKTRPVERTTATQGTTTQETRVSRSTRRARTYYRRFFTRAIVRSRQLPGASSILLKKKRVHTRERP